MHNQISSVFVIFHKLLLKIILAQIVIVIVILKESLMGMRQIYFVFKIKSSR